MERRGLESSRPNIKLNNVELVDRFEQIDDNENEYMLKPHDAFEEAEGEQVNLINDIITAMHGSNVNAMQGIVLDKTSNTNIPRIATWQNTARIIKIILIVSIAVLATAIIIKILLIFNCCSYTGKLWENRQYKRRRPQKFSKEPESISDGTVMVNLSQIAPTLTTSSIVRPKWDRETKIWTLMEGEPTI